MSRRVRRAGAFAAVGSLALAAPLLGWAAAGLFAAVAVLSLVVVTDGPLFELFARPADRQEGALYGLAGFSLSATGLALLVPLFGLHPAVFAASVLVLAYGNLAERAVARVADGPLPGAGAFVAGGLVSGLVGLLLVGRVTGLPGAVSTLAFLAASAALLGALLRSVLFERDDPLVMISIGLLMWFVSELDVSVSPVELGVALGVTAGFGLLAYVLGTASVAGMLTGVFLGLLTVVLGGYGWFAALIAFFGIGGLAAKYRSEEKRQLGLAEANEGARGSGNVLANSAVGLGAVLAFAASPRLPVPGEVFLFAFAASLAGALSDTLSSEIGCLFGGTRLITTFEPVSRGTDGGVTWQGGLAGLAGALIIAGIAFVAFDSVDTAGAGAIVVAGVGGMTVDSLLGATLEGRWLDNQGVNLLATSSAALAGAAIALGIGLV